MAIYAVIECDNCGKQIWYDHVGKTHIERWNRDKGWSIGKKCLCPDCRKIKKKSRP